MALTAIRNLLKGFVIFENNGTPVNTTDRRSLNFIPGTEISITAVDDPVNDEVDVTINSTMSINKVMAHIASY